jgi:sporulation protein YlmC with PRC-barrel domain
MGRASVAPMGFNKPTWTPGHNRHAEPDAHFRQLKRLRARGEQHARESIAARQLEGSLMSLAALLGSPVSDPDGQSVGELRDVFVNWTAGTSYPPMTAIVVRAGHRDVMISARWVEVTAPASIRLRSAKAYARAVKRHSGDVALAHDVLDHQVVDAVGTQIVRPSDVYLAIVRGRVQLVAIEVGPAALVRRLGPKRLRGRIRPHRVIDWGAVHGFAPRPGESERASRSRTAVAGQPGAAIELDGSAAEIRPLRPTETQSALRSAEGDPS